MIYVKQKISFVALGGQKSVLPAPPSPSVALTVLRGQKWCSSWPFVDSKRCSPRPSAALRVLRGSKKGCSPCPSAALVRTLRVLRVLRGQKRCSPRPLVALRGQKKAVLRAPPRPSVSSADKKGVLPAPSPPSRTKQTLPLQSQFTQTPTTPNLYPARKVRPPSGP